MKYPRVLHAFRNSPWAILPEKWMEIEIFLREKGEGKTPAQALERPEAGPEPLAGPATRSGVTMAGRVALLPLFGVLTQRANLLTDFSGGTSTESFGKTFDNLVTDRDVKAIVLVADSPGGSVFGTPELAQKIYDARGQKKVVAIADSLAASAAYWVISQASEVNITPGGMVGSIGVLASHVDESGADAAQGRKVTIISAGKYKAEGDPSQPISAEGLAYMQSQVDAYYSMFILAVARGRGKTENRVLADFGQGRVVMAKDAVARGMADRVATLSQVITRLDGTSAAAAAARAHVASLDP